MTLSEMADYVCSKVGQLDDASVAECRKYINRRHQLIWDFALWKDSQALVTVTGTTGNVSVITFPANVSRVLRLRNTGTQTDVLGVSVGTLFDFDSTVFDQTGNETKFIHLPAIAVGVTMTPGQLHFLSNGNDSVSIVGGDALGGLIRETVQVDHPGAQEVTTIDFTGLDGAHFDTSGTTGQGLGFVLDSSVALFGVWLDIEGSPLSTADFSSEPSIDAEWKTIAIQVNSSDTANSIASAIASALNLAFYGESSDTQYWTATASGAVVTIQDVSTGARTDAHDINTAAGFTVTTPGSAPEASSTVNTYSQLYSVSRPIGYSNTTVDIYDSANTLLGSIAEGETIFPSGGTTGVPAPRQRVQVYPAPSAVQTYLAHVKVNCQSLELDSDRPTLSGCENALLSFAQADMLQRQRQYGKAKEMLVEAQAMLQEMLDLEKNQQAFDVRIIPSDIHGFAHFGDSFGASDKDFW